VRPTVFKIASLGLLKKTSPDVQTFDI